MTRTARALATLAFVLVAALTSVGCTTHYIPNTDLADNPENRKLVDFCEKYRRAVQRKDIAALLTLTSKDYYEDGGNADASDDIDFAGLKDYLGERFQDAKSIRYEIRYRRVSKERDHVYVDYTFTSSWRIPISGGIEDWQRMVDDNRLDIVQDKGGNYLIVSGM